MVKKRYVPEGLELEQDLLVLDSVHFGFAVKVVQDIAVFHPEVRIDRVQKILIYPSLLEVAMQLVVEIYVVDQPASERMVLAVPEVAVA